MKTNRLYHMAGLAWFAIIVSLTLYCAQSLLVEGKIQFDILALLPEGKTEKMRISNQLMDDANIPGRMVILFGHKDKDTALQALQSFRTQIKPLSLPIMEQNPRTMEAQFKALFTSLYPYRAGLIAKDDLLKLSNGKEEELANRAVSNIISPFGSFSAEQIKTDPFGFFPNFVTSFRLTDSIQMDPEGNIIINSGGLTWFVFQGHMTEKVFSLKLQEKISDDLLPILSQLNQSTGVQILKLGAAFYAAAGAQQAKTEISEIGLISTLGIILILLLIFRVPRPIFLAVTVVTTGLIGGLATCLFWYGSIHILALVFGSSLVGVAVDYSLHYYCASFIRKDNKSINRYSILSTLLPALPLGVLTSSIGYGLLIVAPFPGIQQMAILACVGLLCTFISVSLWGPYFIKAGERKVPALATTIQHYLEKFASLGRVKHLRLALSIVVLSIFGCGTMKLTFDDNVRGFQALNPILKSEEEQIKTMMNFDNSSKFLAIQAPDIETVLQTEEALAKDLTGINYQAIASVIPSQKSQTETRAIKLAFSQKYFPQIAATLGISEAFDAKTAGFDSPLLVANEQLLTKLPTGLKELIHRSKSGQITGRIMLNGEIDNAKIDSIIAHYENVQLIDPVSEYTSLFTSYREVMMLLVAGLLMGFALMLSFRQGIRAAIQISTPVLFSILTTMGIIGSLGIGFSMFHAMGLILVLCIGIDYALFLFWRETADQNSHNGDLLLLGNALAAITTILSFGLLSLSSTTAVNSFGFTVFLGIVLNFLITTLFLGHIKCKN